MTDRIVKAIVTSAIFALISSIAVSLIVTALLHFEIVGVVTSAKVLYAAFVIILFITSFIAARMVKSRGWLIGLGIAVVVIVLAMMHRLLGVESRLDLFFLIRSAATVLVASTGAVIGVNTRK
ncbi:MAG: TIGR04086 family membrane protein [Turicibacter sp.]|nr:TIGR04086 family membrane protein [Turicibacter sp.]